jgi:thioredoxin reductase (NADPH)
VSSCAVCDGFFFKDKEVIVVGGGDTAMREAAYLSKLCKKVSVVHRRDTLRAQAALQELVKSKSNVNFIWNTTVEEIIGQDKVTAVKIKNTRTGEISQIQIDGVFIAIGHKPNTDFLKGQLELDEKSYVVRQSADDTHTSVEGVFVAGDVADYHYRQAVTAAGMGCKAAMDAEEYLENINISTRDYKEK